MSNEHSHESSVATYVIVALVLGVITYIEFAIVEYEIAWLSTFWILFWLVLLSVAKFIMVIMFFMHLKDDDNLYTGFFGSGMVFALGTFVVLALLFTLPASFQYFQAETAAAGPGEAAHAEDDGHGETALSDEVLALIETDGYSRSVAEVLATPRPKNLQVTLTGPALADEASYTLAQAPALFAEAPAQDAQADDAQSEETPADEASQAEDSAAADAEQETPAEEEPVAAQDDAESAEGQPTAAEANGAPADWDEELGADVYASNCASCHQALGAGIPGAFPPLAEHIPVLYNADGGRSYLVDVLLYGLQGQISVSGQTYNGVMPGWQQLSDEQIAAVLNHGLTSWGNQELVEDFSPITAQDVADQRGQGLTGQQVLEQREALGLP